jgi:hypothetical protein
MSVRVCIMNMIVSVFKLNIYIMNMSVYGVSVSKHEWSWLWAWAISKFKCFKRLLNLEQLWLWAIVNIVYVCEQLGWMWKSVNVEWTWTIWIVGGSWMSMKEPMSLKQSMREHEGLWVKDYEQFGKFVNDDYKEAPMI